MPTGFVVGNQWREVADTPAAGNFAAMTALVSGAVIGLPLNSGGYNVALAFDSMTDFNFTLLTVSSVTYSAGVLTITVPSTHLMPVGQAFNFWNRTYTSLNAVKYLTVASVVSTTVITAVLPAGDYSGLPATLLGTNFFSPRNWKCSKSWLNWINARGGQRFNIVRNDAQSGDTSTQFLARLPALIEAWRADNVTMVCGQMIGVNDIIFDTVTFANDTERIYTNLKAILDMIRLAGFKLLIGTITPVASGEFRAQRSVMVIVTQMNRWLWKYAQKYADRVVVVDAYSVVVDPTNTTGLARAGFLAAADNIHYTNVGGYRVAVAEQAKVNAAFPVVSSSLPASAADSQAQTVLASPTGTAASNVVTITAVAANIEEGQEVFVRGATGSYLPLNGRQVATSAPSSGSFTFLSATAVPDGAVAGTLIITPSRQLMPDPLNLTTGGSITTLTGTTADVPGQLHARVFAGTITGSASIVADSDGFGNASRITVTAAGAVDARAGWSFKNSVGTVEGRMYPGRTYVFEAKLVLTSTNWAQTPISEITFDLNIGANSTETWRLTDLNQYENVTPLIASGSSTEVLHLKTAPLTIPLGSTLNSAQATIAIRWQAAQAAGTLTMDLSRIAVNDVTADGPLVI